MFFEECDNFFGFFSAIDCSSDGFTIDSEVCDLVFFFVYRESCCFEHNVVVVAVWEEHNFVVWVYYH